MARLPEEVTRTRGSKQKEEEEQQQQLLRTQWIEKDDKLLDELKEAILTIPVLKRPVPNRRLILPESRLEPKRPDASVLLQAGAQKKKKQC